MGLFPSASAAWVISEEEFMKQFPVIDNLKFRIGYGLAGNQSGIDSYTTLNLVKPNGVVPVGNSAIVSLGDLRNTNPDLKWEVKHTFNTGFDIALFGNRLLLSANYYNSRTTDMLYLYNVSVPLSPITPCLPISAPCATGVRKSPSVSPFENEGHGTEYQCQHHLSAQQTAFIERYV